MNKKFTQKEASAFGGKIFFNKYKTIKLIAFGAFSIVYQGVNIKTKEQIAIKIEKKSNFNYLESECSFLIHLKGHGIPEVKSFGVSGHYYILILELLGKSLYTILSENKKPFCLKDVCMIAIQTINRLEFIHSKYIIHRDIKPENFLIGVKDPFVIYLIDFGLSKKYRSSKTQKHLPFSKSKEISGTAEFISYNVMKGICSSRRDDLESLGLILIFLLKADFPWKCDKNMNNKQKFYYIYKKRQEISLEQMCQNLPKQFFEYLIYCRKLNFEEDPNYDYLRNLFENLMKEKNFINDMKFSWIKEKVYKKMNLKGLSNEKTEKSVSVSRKKESKTQRLFKRIQNSFMKEINNNENLVYPPKGTKTAFDHLNSHVSNKYSNDIKTLNNKESEKNVKEIIKCENTTKNVNNDNITSISDYKILKASLNTKENKFYKKIDVKPLNNNNNNNNHFYINSEDNLEFNDINYKKGNKSSFTKRNSSTINKQIKSIASPLFIQNADSDINKIKKTYYTSQKIPNELINRSNNYNKFNLNLTENKGYSNNYCISLKKLKNKNNIQKNMEGSANLNYNKKFMEFNCMSRANNNYIDYNNNYLINYKLINSQKLRTYDLTTNSYNLNQINNFLPLKSNGNPNNNEDRYLYNNINNEYQYY